MLNIILWIDDIRDTKIFRKSCADRSNERVIWCKSVNDAIRAYTLWGSVFEDPDIQLVEIDLDHDAGDFVSDGGDYVKFLDWMELCHPNDFSKIAWKIHTMNPVGAQNMRAILRRNGVNC